MASGIPSRVAALAGRASLHEGCFIASSALLRVPQPIMHSTNRGRYPVPRDGGVHAARRLRPITSRSPPTSSGGSRRDPVQRALATALNEVGHVLGLETIGVQVEGPEVLARLRRIGVDTRKGSGSDGPSRSRTPSHGLAEPHMGTVCHMPTIFSMRIP